MGINVKENGLNKSTNVGYIFSEKKLRQQGLKKFCDYALRNDINFLPVNLNVPIEDQGEFSLIIHKVTGIKYNAMNGDPKALSQLQNLQNYLDQHPSTKIIDSLSSMGLLMDRYAIYEFLFKLLTQSPSNKKLFSLPTTLKLECASSSSNTTYSLKDIQSKVRFPAICKRLMACAKKQSHEMYLVDSAENFLNLPLVTLLANSTSNTEKRFSLKEAVILQEYIPHSGILLKVYSINESFDYQLRPSFNQKFIENNDIIKFDSQMVPKSFRTQSHNITESTSIKNSGLFNLYPNESDISAIRSRLESDSSFESMVRLLSDNLELQLWGVDVIVSNDTNSDLYIIDVNYFPSYTNFPNFHRELLTLIKKHLY